MSFASRRASWRAARRSLSALSRSCRACSASSRPCCTRARRSASIRLSGAPNSQYRTTANTMKLSDETMTQNRLIWSPDGAVSSAPSWTTPLAMPPATFAAANRITLRSSPVLLEDEGEDRHDDREDAEALGERGAEDELGADLRRRVGVAADRGGGQPGQDADADAGADDAESREAGAEGSEFHGVHLLR